MSWLLEIGKGEAATSAFETEIDAYPRSCCVASEEGLLTMCCKAGRGLYWIWIGSSPEFTQISFCWIFKKKKFKWNCFRSWVIDCRKSISNKLRWRSYVLERLLLADLIYLSFVICWFWAWLQHSKFNFNDFSQNLQLSKAFL